MNFFGKKKKLKGIFANPVDKVVQASKEKNQIPLPLVRCVTLIEEIGMNMEGIYRVSGSYKQMADIQQLYDKGLDPDLKKYDRYVITGVIKKYFALLPEPVMTYKLYDQFLRAQATRSERKRIETLKKLVNELPKENFLVLEYIISHLKKISEESNVTKMSVQNLAIVFGPTLFRNPEESATRILTDSPLLSGAVSSLIQHHDFIFKDGELGIEQEEELEESSDRFDISKVDFGVLEQGYSDETSKFARRQNSFFEKRRKKLKTNVEVEETEEGDLKGQIITDTVNEELKSDGVKISVEECNETEPEEEDVTVRKSITYEQTESEEKVTLEETEKEFEERLSNVVVDLKDPQIGILERINIKRKREMRTDIFDQMSLEELKLEKNILKQELRHFEDLFYQTNGFEPTNEDKNTLRPIYHRYKTVKGRIDKFQRSNSLSTVHSTLTDQVENQRRRKTLNMTITALTEIKDEDYQELKQEKRELQKKLLEFEKEFFEKNGRKVTKKSDREGMEETYEKYSEIKSKLTAIEEAQK